MNLHNNREINTKTTFVMNNYLKAYLQLNKMTHNMKKSNHLVVEVNIFMVGQQEFFPKITNVWNM